MTIPEFGPFLASLRDYSEARANRTRPPAPRPPVLRPAPSIPPEPPRPPALIEMLGALLTLAKKGLPWSRI
ncbi:hypothetical protein [Nocardia wallacei]|uniref:hypothetical protein n=1 Tax=Nocardia wallacei TaxID=480035 RepID=UPI0024552C63|nr:hypothetical protein [Nocardia wallacei]